MFGGGGGGGIPENATLYELLSREEGWSGVCVCVCAVVVVFIVRGMEPLTSCVSASRPNCCVRIIGFCSETRAFLKWQSSIGRPSVVKAPGACYLYSATHTQTHRH